MAKTTHKKVRFGPQSKKHDNEPSISGHTSYTQLFGYEVVSIHMGFRFEKRSHDTLANRTLCPKFGFFIQTINTPGFLNGTGVNLAN
jgi:hypothetical protein